MEDPPSEEDSLTDALDAVGRRSEAIRGRISNLHERLEDLTTLKDEFVAFVGPLADLITEFPEVESKLHDAETILTQLRETNATLVRDLQAVRTHNIKLTDEVTALTSTNQDLFARIDDMDASIDGLRHAFSDKESLASDLEKRLFAETEHGRALSDENEALRRETQEADQTVARLERTLAETREQN
jgi:crescentin